MPLYFSKTLQFSHAQTTAFTDWLHESTTTARTPEFLFSPEPAMTYIDGLAGPFAITARKHRDFDNSSVSIKVVTERATPENAHDDRVICWGELQQGPSLATILEKVEILFRTHYPVTPTPTRPVITAARRLTYSSSDPALDRRRDIASRRITRDAGRVSTTPGVQERPRPTGELLRRRRRRIQEVRAYLRGLPSQP